VQQDVEPAPPHAGFAVRLVEHDRRLMVVAKGEIDQTAAPAFAAAIEKALARGSSLGLHLADVTFIDSSGLRVLHRAHVQLGRAPRSIVLVDPGPEVLTALRLAGLDRLFPIELN